MPAIEKMLHTAKAHATGGRDGASRASDGRLDATSSSLTPLEAAPPGAAICMVRRCDGSRSKQNDDCVLAERASTLKLISARAAMSTFSVPA